MDIHAPDKPILTLREAASHLTIVTVGILIALSLEGVVESRTVARWGSQEVRRAVRPVGVVRPDAEPNASREADSRLQT